MKKVVKYIYVFLFNLSLILSIPTIIQAAEKVEDSPKVDTKKVIISNNNNYYAETDIINASKYFYDYTGLHLYYVHWTDYVYDEEYTRQFVYKTEQEWLDALYEQVNQIDDEYKVVLIDSISSKGNWKGIEEVIFGSIAEEIFSLDEQTILSFILTESNCVIEDYETSTYRTRAIKKIVPLIMQNELDLETFMDEYYYSWQDNSYYDSTFFILLGFISIYWAPISVCIIFILAVIFIRLAIIHKHGYKKVEELKASNESKELDTKILNVHMDDYADILADKYTKIDKETNIHSTQKNNVKKKPNVKKESNKKVSTEYSNKEILNMHIEDYADEIAEKYTEN